MAGLEPANGRAMMFGVHGGEEISGGFVVGLVLPAAPFHEEAVADPAEQAHQPHGLGKAHPAQVIPVADVQALVQAAFDAPGRPIV